MSKRVLGATLALTLGLALAACGSGGPTAGNTATGNSTTASSTPATAGSSAGAVASPVSSPGSSAVASGEHNAVDVMFVTMMIPHHEGAIEMSDLALTRASTQPVKDLAARIKAAQGPEIEQMQDWLTAWDAAMPTTGMSDDMGHGMGHGSPTTGESTPADFGMGDMMEMSEADLAALTAATGVAFDKLFLQQMVAHHRGAIDMAEVEIAQGLNAQALALAEAIRTSQTVEIAEMQQLLSTM